MKLAGQFPAGPAKTAKNSQKAAKSAQTIKTNAKTPSAKKVPKIEPHLTQSKVPVRSFYL